ncbi:MAG TPA: DUF6776 family protein [Candidatus Acidoferrum sp.]|nr:DUF6776 family protein [Candidatus Acidoferrum sp.]
MVVVPRRWWHGARGRLLVGLTLLACALVLFWLGTLYEAGSDATTSLINRLSSARIEENGSAISALKEQLVKTEQSSNVDRLALQDLRVNIQRLRQQISQLEEDVLFYKQIADTGSHDSSRGLVISAFDLLATSAADHFRYKIKFEKIGNPNTMIEGSANIAVTGVKDNMDLTLPLSALTNSSQGDSIKLRFRSFQDVEGEITIPYGFEPSRIEILAVTEDPESKTLQKNFSWLVETGQKAIAK